MKIVLTAVILILGLTGFSCLSPNRPIESVSSGRICYADSGKDVPYLGPEVQLPPDPQTEAALGLILSATEWPTERLDRPIKLQAGDAGGHTAASFVQDG